MSVKTSGNEDVSTGVASAVNAAAYWSYATRSRTVGRSPLLARVFAPGWRIHRLAHALHKPRRMTQLVATSESRLTTSEPGELRTRALREGRRAEENLQALGVLWRELTHGEVVVIDHFFFDERCWVVVRDRTRVDAKSSHPNARRVDVLTRILLGEQQKVIALSLAIGASTVAVAARQCLHAMGVATSATSVPAVLVVAANAHADRSSVVARRADFVIAGVRHRVLSIPRPPEVVRPKLTGAERAVIGLLVERHSNADIARIRGASMRTVANQVSSVFRKFNVGARTELLCRLIGCRDRAAVHATLQSP